MAGMVKEIEKKYVMTRDQLRDLIRGLMEGLDKGKVVIDGDEIVVPEENLQVEYGFEIEKGRSEIEIEIKWKEGTGEE